MEGVFRFIHESLEQMPKSKKKAGQMLGLLQRIEEPTCPREVINMAFVIGLNPAGTENCNNVLLVVDRSSRRCRFLAFHEEIDAAGTALLFWEKSIVDCSLPRIIISERDPKFTSQF